MNWYEDLVRDYLGWLLRRGRSANTVRAWRSPLREFGLWLRSQHVLQPEALTRLHIEGFQDCLRQRVDEGDRSPRTAMGAATALKGLLRYAELERDELGLRPGLVWRVVVPKAPEYLPRPLERQDVQKVLRYFARPTKDLVFLRDRALFATLLTSGARISEALQMRIDQVEHRGPIVVRQKGNREKRLVISDTARTWIEQYLRVRGRDDEPSLWMRELGPGVTSARPRLPLSQNAVNLRWAVLARRLRIRRFTSHQLRHTAGTELMARGARDAEIQSVLGHANTNMIRRYALVQEERRQELVNGLDSLIPGPAGGNGHVLGFRRSRRRRR